MRESEEERSLFDEFLRKWGEVEEREVALEEEKRGGSIEIERVACFCGRRGWRSSASRLISFGLLRGSGDEFELQV